MDLKIKDIWNKNGHLAIDHWGALKSEPLDADLTSVENFKEFLIGQYGWDEKTAEEELKWFSDFSRTFESE
ncbi:hypothetical protein [Anaerococcus sp. Marseille-Q5996]|uniref:hypothetical protein n=1 Tax=Anaerococcus sp. Marseille-Q5996 TaxID=2972769 RepID=UPI0021CA3297|nr:hypothetical protein [Anaerococcus sp. Marseille-Q5996]